MGITFNPKEMLAAIASSCVAAFCMAEGMPPDDVVAVRGLVEGTVKGFGIRKKASPIIEKLEYTIKEAIHHTIQINNLEHLPSDFEEDIFENAFSAELIKKYLTVDDPVELLGKTLKRTLASSEMYDIDTLPMDSLAVSLVKTINEFIYNNQELTVLSSFYVTNNINTVLQALIPHISEFEKAILNMKQISAYIQPSQLHFLNSKIGFCGRTDEFQWLNDFQNSPYDLQYAFVLGCTGVGKSRLLHEYINQYKDETDWYSCFLNDNLLNKLMDFDSYECSKNLFVVIDYVGRFSERIGKWVLRLAELKHLTNKMRIVLIERQGIQEIADIRSVVPWMQEFYGNAHQKNILKTLEYGWLRVPQLDKPDLFRIMDDYSTKVANKSALSVEEKEKIFEYVSTGLKIENSRQNPLFVLLATDAFLREGSIRNWDIHLLAQSYIDKMLDYWLESLCKNDKILFGSLMAVAVFATAIGGIDLNDEIPNFISNDLDRMIQVEECSAIFENAGGLEKEIILPIQPDYIGELVFLDYLRKMFPKRKRHDLLDSLYFKPKEFMSFFARCIEDFADSEVFKPLFDDIVNLAEPTDKTPDNYAAFAYIIANYVAHISQINAQKCADVLEMILADKVIQGSEYADFIADLYAGILAQMTFFTGYDGSANLKFSEWPDWSLSVASGSVGKLRVLYNNFLSKRPSILLSFAEALANCSIYSTYIEAMQCADELRELYEKHGVIEPKIAAFYAMALNNTVCKITDIQDISLAAYAEDAVGKLSELYDKHVSNAKDYSDTVVCIVNAVSDVNLRKSIDDHVKRLHVEMRMKQMKVAVEYAKALNNIVGLYAATLNNKANEHFAMLEKIYHVHKDDDQNISIEYAKGIVAFMAICENDKADQMLHVVRDLCESYKENKYVFDILIVRYVNAIHNRLAVIALNSGISNSPDWAFSEILNIYNRYEYIRDKLSVCYIRAFYYMFYIKLCNNCLDDCKLLLNAAINILDTVDSTIFSTVVEYINEMERLLYR